MSQPAEVLAAGAVVLRRSGRNREVLLVHRPRYDDWSFPKGKLDRGECLPRAAVRETDEETGLQVRLAVPLTSQRYRVNGRPKVVHYWTARVVGSDDVSGYEPNKEVDEVAWVPVREARRRLTYERDREVLDEALQRRRRTDTLVILRHGKAWPRKNWRHDDRLRPLLVAGVVQAERLPGVLAAWDVQRVLSSSSTRCVQTVTPYAASTGLALETTHALSEEDSSTDGLNDLADSLLSQRGRVLVCSHRPVLPGLLDALGVPETKLEAGGMLVLQHRDGVVVSVEHVPAP